MFAFVLALYIAAAECQILAAILQYRESHWEEGEGSHAGTYAIPEPTLRPLSLVIFGTLLGLIASAVGIIWGL